MNVIVIPARMGSTRLPGKPLIDIDGTPMVVRCAQQAARSVMADEVIVATDSMDVVKAIWRASFPKLVSVEMTDKSCKSGTDRIASLTYSVIGRDDIVVNWQGDLPFADPRIADQLFMLMTTDGCSMATCCNKRRLPQYDHLYDSPHTVKVLAQGGYAASFSRTWGMYDYYFLHHFGMYAYRHATLQRFYKTEQSPDEIEHGLEQLRAMSLHIPIRILITEYEAGIEINTEADLERIHAN